MGIEFERTTDPSGLVLYDRIEQRQLQIRTAEAVDPVVADTDGFCFPVDAACTFETGPRQPQGLIRVMATGFD